MKYIFKILYATVVFTCLYLTSFSQVNDNCANAYTIPIPGNGYGNGIVYTDTIDITSATSEIGEYYSPGVPNGKSVWYKFSLPTTKKVIILLDHLGNNPLNTAGWSLFKTNGCLPGNPELLDPPIFQIEGYTHSCLLEGDYLLQLSADYSLSDSMFFRFDILPSDASEVDFDFAGNAYDFGTVSSQSYSSNNYEIGCQSLFENEVACVPSDFSKSTWQTFTTDNYVDLIRFRIGESPWNAVNSAPRIWYVNLYEGDISVDSTGIPLIDSCIQMVQTSSSNTNRPYVDWMCELDPNTTYSIQILSQTEYFGTITTQIAELGIDSTQGADATNLPANNSLGILNLGQTYNVTDYFSCNSQWDFYSCPPYTDTIYAGQPPANNPLNWWVTFELNVASGINLEMLNYSGGPIPTIQLFQGDVESTCNLTPIPSPYFCLQAGTYSVLVTGDGMLNNGYSFSSSNLGEDATLRIVPTLNSINQFGLQTPGSFDSINNLQALVPGQNYPTSLNYFDCETTVLPQNEICSASGLTSDRAMYRVIYIDSPGYLFVGNGNQNSPGGSVRNLRYKVFEGNLANLPIVGNEIIGATAISCCTRMYYNSEDLEICVDSGYYTIVTFIDESYVNISDPYDIEFNTLATSLFNDPLTPEVLDTVSLTNLSVSASQVQITCLENPEDILGNTPCSGYNNLVYREFYLDEPLSLNFINTGTNATRHRVFAGRRSQNAVSSLTRNCFLSNTSNICDTLPAGWYTIVSYSNVGTTAPFCGVTSLGNFTGISIQVNLPLDTPLYNTFPKADSVFLEWSANPNHTDTVPSYSQTISLDPERFNCFDDLNFPPGIVPCIASNNRISYRTIYISKPSNLYVYNIGLQSVLYEGDITTLSPPYNIMHPCTSGEMRLCIDSGVYTFVTFAGNAQAGSTFSADFYVDSLGGESKFNHASQAYNFGTMPLNGNTYFYNPSIPTDSADANGNPGSNDFIMCSTDAALSDPQDLCNNFSNASGNRKDLWYTFVLDQPGTCTVDVNTLTDGKRNVSWAIYECDNINYPLIDSTSADLSLIARSKTYCSPYYTDVTQLSFYRDACGISQPKRYVVFVSNTNNWNNYQPEEANIQVEVGVTFTGIGATLVQYDHFSSANEINATPTLTCNAPYNNDTISYGTYIGCEGNLLCATLDATDQNTCGANTIWYKFNVFGSGTIKLNYERTDNNTIGYNAADIQLYRSVIPGDSTSAGLQRIPLSAGYFNNNPEIPGNNLWGTGCFSTGTYYIMITGCNFPTATVRPNIWMENIEGDFCFDAIPYIINSEDSSSVTGVVDCWTIGEAPGEDGTNMDCLGSPVGQKSGWFQLAVANDTVYDIDISLNENTSAPASEFSYRIANGDCESLTYQNCVEDGGFLTLNLKCRNDSALYIQVVLPDYATGTVDLNVVTTISTDTACTPVNPFIPNASFTFETACEFQEIVFINESTQGPNVNYLWDFGDGFTSTIENPSHLYNAPSSGNFLVTLIVENNGESDTTQRLLNILPVPDPVFTVSQPVIAGQQAGIINFSFDTIPGVEYFWEIASINDTYFPVDTITTWNPNYTFPNEDEYYICFHINNAYCDTVICDTISVQNLNIFSGGPYDGFDVNFTICPDSLEPIFAGGPFDGFDVSITTCPDSLEPIFAGGPYDGFDVDYTTCPIQSLFAGGFYDGEGTAVIFETCNTNSIFSGGFYDGEGTAILIEDCIPEINVFAGGPYDGFDLNITVCPDSLQAIFAGGPFDGFDVNFTVCPDTILPIFGGGPYDGFDVDFTTCPLSEPIFAGGPYDGFDVDFNQNGDDFKQTICVNESGILGLNFATDWYASPTSVTPLISNTDTFNTGPLANTQINYFSSPCYPNAERWSYVTEVIQQPTPDFSLSTSCAGQSTTFSNQTLVTGPNAPTIGTDIVGASSAGSTPSTSNISFSTSSYTNFARFTDGVLNATAWYENNTLETTEWIQVNYITAKSLNEIDFWTRLNGINYQPKQLRLYYSNGGPWQLVYVDENPSQNFAGAHYNSGFICAASNVYAERWKIEVDTKDAYRFDISELQLFASDPVIGGNINWTIDGNAASGQNVVYTFQNPGIYDVVIEVTDSCSCPIVDTVQVEILAVEDVQLLTTDVSCINGSDGSLELEINTTETVDFYWYNTNSIDLSINSLDTGTYWVYVENITQGCGDTIFTTITQPDSGIYFDYEIVDSNVCNGLGSVWINASGGTAPFTIIWNAIDTVDTLNNVIGWQFFEIIDSNECSIYDSLFIDIDIVLDSTFAFVSSCNPLDTGVSIVTNINQFACDSVHTITTTLLPTSFDTTDIAACDSVLLLGNWILSSTSFTDTIIGGAANGCDSITTFNVTINNSDSTFATATSCNPADTGVASVTNLNVNACDSVHTITTTLLPTSFDTTDITACDSALVLGNWILSSTSFEDTIVGGAVNGCDSITTFNITINNSDSTFATATSCNPADTGIVSVTNPNVNACDSVHTITTTLLPTSFDTTDITACDSALVLGNWILSSTSFEDTIVGGAVNGCDSITTFNITINNSDSTFATATSCNPADTGIVSVTNPNVNACDSVHTITTTLLPTSFDTTDIAACDSALVLGSWILSSTSFEDTIVGGAANGCDSITTFNVTINSSDSTFATATSCNPADTGIVSVTNPNVNACDSVHTITTTLLPTSFDTTDITACDSALVLGNWILSSTSFEDTIVGGAVNGCDSITTFNITINNSDSTFATATSCNPADTGIVSVTNPNVNACDSVHTITTTLLQTSFDTTDITACDSALVLGNWILSSTSFEDTIVGGAANGCDSITTFNVTINSSDSTFATATSCNPADTGVASVTNPNVNACDSVHTITTTLLPTSFDTTDITACDSALVLGNWILSSTSFEDTIIGGAANGCDSITTFNVTINNSDSTFATATSCNPADTGIVSVTNPNVNACDSVHTITTTLLPTSFDTTDITACDSALVLGNWILSSTSFEDTIVGGAANGCDSITTFNVTINSSDSTFATATSCNPADTGVASVTNPNVNACDSVHTITTTLLPTSFDTTDITACDSALVLGNWILSSTSFEDTIVGGAANGCDSITTFNVTINNSDSTFATATSCNPADTGIVSVTNPNVNACDSVHTITTTLLPTSFDTTDLTACDSALVLGNWILSSTTFEDTIVGGAANGCDSITTFNVTINNSDSTFATATSCNPADTGIVSVTNPNVNACDSVHTITTTLLPTSFDTTDLTACDSALVLGNWILSSTTFEDTIVGGAANGCDSITTFNVTINNSDSTFATATSCNPADTGIVSVTNPNVNACDSVHTITTTLLPTSFDTTDIAACDSALVLGNWILSSTSFEDTIIGGAANGCDSITTFNVTINNSDSTFATATSCNPADTGIVSVTNPNVNACDSVHTITTTLLPTSFDTTDIAACDSALVLGNWILSSTSFEDTIVGGSANGCDSITTFNVTINNSDSTFAIATSCNPADTGIVSVTNPNVNACDSVHTITTTLLPTSFDTTDLTACDSALVLGNWILSSTSFEDTIVGGSANGCDSITTFNVTINSSDSTFATATSCNPADTGIVSITNPNINACDSVHTITTTLLQSDSTFATATSCNPADTGIVSVTNPNVNACDSVHTITTTLLPTSFDTTDITACDSALVLGNWILSSTSFEDTIVGGAVNGCDSITTFNVTINNSDSTFATATSCNPADTGIVSVTNPNVNACDSVHTITTTLLPTSFDTTDITACDSALVLGNWILSSTSFEDTIVGGAVNGCDSITTFNVTINNSDSTFATATSCNPADTGIVSVTNPNVNACDSVHTVTTTLIPTSFATENITACDSTFAAGSWLFASSSFNDTIIGGANNGCDSITTFNVTINNSDSTFATATSCNPADTGVASVTNPNVNACDSVHTITTTLLPTSFDTTDLTACDSALVLGNWILSSTSFEDTIVGGAVNGCDSITTFNVTINNSDSTFATATSCNPADTGIVSITNSNVNACDSVHTITTTLLPTSFDTTDLTACDSALVLGNWILSSTSFEDTIVGGAVNGCDSITTFNVTINNSDSTFATATSCNPADTGIVSVTNPNASLCDSVHTITTTLAPFSSATENVTACDSALVLGSWILSSTSFEDTIVGGAANGCDSITTFNVTINNSDSTFATATSCNPTDTGIVSVTNPNVNACDSVHTITTTLLPTSFDTTDIAACDSAFVLGNWILSSTSFEDTIIGGAANGCDSITTFNVTINNSDSTFANATSCNPADTGTVSVTNPNTSLCDSVHTITTTLLQSDSTFATATSCNPADTGVVSVTNPNTSLCDSVHTITTTLAPFSSATENVTACDSALVLGSWILSSTTFEDTIVGGAANGCDSITTFNVTINNSDSTFATATSCNPADTGIVSVTNPNVNACDSVHTITTTLAPFSSATENVTACDSALVLGNWILSSTTFEDTIVGGAANGCDSITTFNVTINNSDSTFATATSCNPADTGIVSVTNPNTSLCDSVHTITTTLLQSDSTFATATSCNPADTGVVSVTNPNTSLCDSVHTITTTLAPFSSATENVTACDSALVLGSWILSSTTFEDTIVGGAANGCDSITTFNVTINSSDSTFATATSCNPADTGVASVTNPNVNACDSVHTITTTLAPFSSATENVTACDSALVLGSWILSSASFEDTIVGGAANGCDSITTFNVTINNSDSTFATATSCNPADTGIVSVTNPNVNACDSVHTITTTLLPTSFDTTDITACDSALVLGNWILSSTSFEDTIIGGAANGCDSITTFNVTINNSDSTFATATSCNPADTGVASVTNPNVNACDSVHTITTTLLQSDSTFATATSCNPADTGIVSVTNPNTSLCDSVHTITTTLAPFSSATENVTACDSALVLGNWILSSTTFEDTIVGGAANGCDSITTFNVTINNSDSTFANATSCNPADTGIVSVTNPNVNACDSVHTITTTLAPFSSATENVTTCDSALVLGNWILSSTSFEDTIVGGAANGCDSITTFNVTINSSDSTFATATSCNPADTGIVSVTNPNVNACDSVHTITTTLAPFSSATENVTACDSALVLGSWILSSTSFEDTIIGGAANGCDSITTFNVTINSSDSTFATATSCNPADTGTVSVTNPNVNACDSVHTITTTLAPFSSATENVSACDSALVLGNWILSSTSFEDTIVGGAANGCDSITTFNVTINSSDSTFATATSCNPADTGITSVTNPNVNACDSVHTITTTLAPFSSATENVSACDSALVLGNWILSSTSFEDTIIGGAANGCDSITTFNVTINNSDSTFASATSCNPADTGTVSVTNPNVNACDSIHTITTTLAPFSSATENVSACDSALVLGNWILSSTSFEDTIVGGAANGCDSITTFNVTINNSDSTFANATSCNPADTGIVSVTNPNVNACDSVHTITTTLAPFSSATENVTACDSALVLGSWILSSSSFEDTIIGGAANGCDSITTFNVTINNSDSTFANATSCNPADTGVASVTNPNMNACDSVHTITTTLLQSDSTFANATSCNPADTGTVSVTNPNVNACDSVHTVTTTLIPTSFATENITACDSTFAAGSWLFASSSFNDTIIGGANNGCDSITTFNVTINSSDSTFATATSCNPADTGVASVTNPNVNACDSVHTITTTLAPFSSATENVTACDSALVLGSWILSSTTFEDTIIGGAANGCDSITTFNVTINNSDSTFATATSCNPADTGVASVTNPNVNACDSVHTITTTLAPFSSSTENVTACDSALVLGNWILSSTSFEDTIIGGAANGCDSITTFNVTINSSDSTFATITSCNPADTGIASVTNPNVNACDSVHTITTTLAPFSSATENVTACDSALVLGNWILSSTSFEDTIIGGAANGCDSITTFNVTINNSDSTFATATSCNPADTGITSVTNPNVNACDSVHTITTTLAPFSSATENVSACDSALVLGNWILISTTFEDTIVGGAANGCDSITTFNVTINNSDSTFATATSCNPADTGIVSVTNPNVNACDSVHTITTTLAPFSSATENVTACDSALVLGSWILSSTSFEDTIVGGAANGCDSITTFNVTINNSDSTFATATSCNPADTGVASVTNPNVNACDSVHTITTTLAPFSSATENVTACDSALVLRNWILSSTSFEDTIIGGAANGCDSITTFNVTINSSDSTFATATSCNPADTGIVSVTNPNASLCDSVHTITTTLAPFSSATENVTACDSTLVLGSWILSSTSFEDTIVGGAANGCDSITTFNVTINSSDSTFANATSCNPADTGVASVTNPNVNACDSVHTITTTLLQSDSTFATATSCNPADTGIVSVTNPNVNACDSVHTITTTLAPFSSATENVTACDSALVLGSWILSSTTFEDTIIGGAANGCDSITTFNVTINSSDSTFANATSCNPADTGIVSVTNPNASLCDSVHTITTTLIPTSFATENITACDSTFAAGSWLFASGTFNDTLIGGADNGCDSITTFNITINSSDSTFATATSCNPADTGIVSVTNPNVNACDSVHTITTTLLQSDSTFATATSCNPADTGIVSVTNPNVNACDSAHTITTTLAPFSSATENVTACDSALVLGSWILSSTTFEDTIIGGAANGCDSITTFNVTINSSDSTFANATSCNPADTGVASVTNPNVNACDSVHTITTTLIPTSFATENITACDSTFAAGSWLFASGTFNDTLIGGADNGCDSITTFNITINSSDSTFATATSCNPADTGIVSVTNPNVNACDSVHTITTTLLQSDSTFATATSCNPADTGIVSVTNPNVNACDSAHTITTTLAPFSSATENVTACDSALVLGSWILSSTTFEDTIIGGAANGCDSITTFNVTINSSDSTFANATSCNPADTGIVSVTNPNASLCDSVHTITTTLIPTSFATENITACDSTFAAGSWLYASGSFNDTLIGGAANGCDSITTFNITINSSDSTFATATSCNPADTGIVSVTNPNINACDSVHTVTTTLIPTSFATENITACDSTFATGFWLFASSSFNDTIIGGANNGCDSITTFNITINSSDSTFSTVSSCNPADTGIVSVTNPNVNACDSVHTITTTLLPTSLTTENIIACDSVFVLGSWILSSTTFEDTIVGGATNGCDSITTFNVTINSSDSTFATATSCNPADTGIVSVTNPNQFACDSTHTVTTILLPSDSTFANATSCNPADTGIASITNVNQFGCDSVHTVTTSLLSSDSTFSNANSCNPADIGIVSITTPNQFGCDSVHTVTTSLLPSNATFSTATSCLVADTGVLSTLFTNQFGCDSTHTITTTLVLPIALENFLEDTTMCIEEIYPVIVENPGSDFIWSNGTLGPVLLPDATGMYYVEFTQDSTGCIVSDTVIITIENCIDNCYIQLPTAFSPNASLGVNDLYRIITDCDEGFSEFEFSIYNRWGELVFYTEDPLSGWDGFYQNTNAPIGVYVYKLNYTKNITNESGSLSGNVTLIR